MARDRRKSFVKLAEKRVNKTIKNIKLIGNLADRSNYCYDDDQVVKIIDALESEMIQLRARFERGGEIGAQFSLSSPPLSHL